MSDEVLSFIANAFFWVCAAFIVVFLACAIYGIVTGAMFRSPDHVDLTGIDIDR